LRRLRVIRHYLARGLCLAFAEPKLARKAQAETLAYMQGDVRLEFVDAPEKFGRLVVRAPELQKRLIAQGLAKLSKDGKR